jgi:hypothetical protein
MKVLDQVRDVMRRKHYSIRTEYAYLNWVKQYILFHKKCHPEDVGEKEIGKLSQHTKTISPIGQR